MVDDLDERLARRFAELEALDVPDTWTRVLATADQPVRDVAEPRRRGILVAAAVAAVVAGGVAVLRVGGSNEAGQPASTAAPREALTTTTGTTATTTTASVDAGLGEAVITPSVVSPGAVVTITPTRAVEVECGQVAVIYAADSSHRPMGQLTPDGGWATFEPGPGPTWLSCLPQPSAQSVSYRVPSQLADGLYELCLSRRRDRAGCATFTVDRSTAAATSTSPAIDDDIDGGPGGAVRCGGAGAPEATLAGTRTTHSFPVNDFDEISAHCIFDLDVRRGNVPSVEVTVDQNLADHIQVEVDEGVLLFNVSAAFDPRGEPERIRATVVMPELHAFSAGDAVSATLTGFESTRPIDIRLSGDAQLRGTIRSGDVSLIATEAAIVDLDGEGNHLSLTAQSAASIHLEAFAARDADIVATEAAQVYIRADGRLDVRAAGSSEVKYYGAPTLGEIQITETATVGPAG